MPCLRWLWRCCPSSCFPATGVYCHALSLSLSLSLSYSPSPLSFSRSRSLSKHAWCPIPCAACACIQHHMSMLRIASDFWRPQSASCRRLDGGAQAQLCTTMVHLTYSAGALVGAVWLIMTQAHRLAITWRCPDGGSSPLADALVCISAGFFAFQLWMLVHQGCGSRLAVLIAGACYLCSSHK